MIGMSDPRNNPVIWIAACLRLLNTLAVINRGIHKSSDIERLDAELSAMMLAGFAFENAFKARFLKQGGTLYRDGKLKDFRDHAFTSWAKQHQIEMSALEEAALDKAEFFSVAWSRYPAHTKLEKERAFETWGWMDVERIQSLTRRLLEDAKL